VEYIFVIRQVTGSKTDGHILFLDSFPGSEYDIATTINLNDVIDEFSSVKTRKVTL
jgi:hypothetical protein